MYFTYIDRTNTYDIIIVVLTFSAVRRYIVRNLTKYTEEYTYHPAISPNLRPTYNLLPSRPTRRVLLFKAPLPPLDAPSTTSTVTGFCYYCCYNMIPAILDNVYI